MIFIILTAVYFSLTGLCPVSENKSARVLPSIFLSLVSIAVLRCAMTKGTDIVAPLLFFVFAVSAAGISLCAENAFPALRAKENFVLFHTAVFFASCVFQTENLSAVSAFFIIFDILMCSVFFAGNKIRAVRSSGFAAMLAASSIILFLAAVLANAFFGSFNIRQITQSIYLGLGSKENTDVFLFLISGFIAARLFMHLFIPKKIALSEASVFWFVMSAPMLVYIFLKLPPIPPNISSILFNIGFCLSALSALYALVNKNLLKSAILTAVSVFALIFLTTEQKQIFLLSSVCAIAGIVLLFIALHISKRRKNEILSFSAFISVASLAGLAPFSFFFSKRLIAGIAHQTDAAHYAAIMALFALQAIALVKIIKQGFFCERQNANSPNSVHTDTGLALLIVFNILAGFILSRGSVFNYIGGTGPAYNTGQNVYFDAAFLFIISSVIFISAGLSIKRPFLYKKTAEIISKINSINVNLGSFNPAKIINGLNERISAAAGKSIGDKL